MDGETKGMSSMDKFGRGYRRAVVLVAVALAVVCSAARADDEGPPKRGASLGLATQRISDTWREKNAYRASGVLVIGVDPSGRAAKGGIATGDVLVSVDGRTLREPSDLGYAERTLHVDQPVAVVLARDGGHSIKMFDIAPLTDAGPSATPAAPAEAPATVSAATTDAPASPAAAPESSSSSFMDSSAFGSEPSTAADGKLATSASPSATVILSHPDAGAAPAEKSAGTKSGAEELGVRAQPLTPDLATALGSEGVEGLLVLEVGKETPADHAGLRAGDIIFKVGDQPVKDLETLDQAVAVATNPAAINMLRRGDQQMVLAPLEGHPAPANAGAAASPEEQQQVINELQGEVASLKKELADLREQIAKLVQESAKK
jgi:membrane-associated protease RseP (regulator of RpoE activity)